MRATATDILSSCDELVSHPTELAGSPFATVLHTQSLLSFVMLQTFNTHTDPQDVFILQDSSHCTATERKMVSLFLFCLFMIRSGAARSGNSLNHTFRSLSESCRHLHDSLLRHLVNVRMIRLHSDWEAGFSSPQPHSPWKPHCLHGAGNRSAQVEGVFAPTNFYFNR